MASSISDIQKKRRRGRPSTGGQMPGVMVRMPEAALARLDRWIAAQPGDWLSRPEAIRRLIEVGLRAEAGVRAPDKPFDVKPGQRWRGPHPDGGAICQVEVTNVLGNSVECRAAPPYQHFLLSADLMMRSPGWVFIGRIE